MAKGKKPTGRQALLPIMTHEYIPPNGDTTKPIKVHSVQDYSPGDHSGRVDGYVILAPEGVYENVPERTECETWEGVLHRLSIWFSDDKPEARLKRTSFNRTQHPWLTKED